MPFIVLKQPVYIDGILVDPSGGAVEVSAEEAHSQICSGAARDVTAEMKKATKAKAPTAAEIAAAEKAEAERLAAEQAAAAAAAGGQQ